MKNNEQEYEKMLFALAKFVSEEHRDRPSFYELLKSAATLDKHLKQVRVQWRAIAESIGVSRDKLYHWYYETHLRHSTPEKLNKQDRELIYEYILQGIVSGRICDRRFPTTMRVELFKDRNIHRSDFSMTYNNILRNKATREAMVEYNIELPNRRRQAPAPDED